MPLAAPKTLRTYPKTSNVAAESPCESEQGVLKKRILEVFVFAQNAAQAHKKLSPKGLLVRYALAASALAGIGFQPNRSQSRLARAYLTSNGNFRGFWIGSSLYLATALAFASVPWLHASGQFVNATQSAHLDYTQYSQDRKGEPSEVITAGGAAAGDFDNDGWVDLFVTRLDDTDILFRNLGGELQAGEAVRFEDVTQSAGITLNQPTNGAAWADIDRDGDLDLYISTISHSRFYLYLNNGDGTFTEDAANRGLALESSQNHKGQTLAFGDYDRDGWIDIHTTEWGIDRDHPDILQHSALLRNRGAQAPGVFVNLTPIAGVELDSNLEQHGFTSAFSDLDGDGWPDLAVASDFFSAQLFWNNGDGTFTEGTDTANINLAQTAMGSAIGDYDRDGDLDWFVTSTHDNRLYRNNGDRTFTDMSETLGVADGDWGWGSTFFDMDNDGDLDIVMTNGFYHSNLSDAANTVYTIDRMRLWRNEGGTFTEVAHDYGIFDNREGRALIKFDYDNDGDLDIFVVNSAESPVLYRNDINSGNDWIRVKLLGRSSNLEGIGARLSLKIVPDSLPLIEEITGGGQFLGHSESIAHFGLGPNVESVSSLQIHWPSGIVQELSNLAPNQLHLIEEPDDDGLVPPIFISQTEALTIERSSPLELSVQVSGNPTPVINWYKDGEKIEGASGPTLRLKRSYLFDTATYEAEAINTAGTRRSAPINVEIDWDISHLSVARAWNEVLLDAIRKDFPAPTIHGRNLYHTSAAMWDAFWAYEPASWQEVLPAFHQEELATSDYGDDRVAAQHEAISYAAYRLLYQRYEKSVGKSYTLHAIRWLMNEYGYDPDFEGVDGNTPAAVGNRIGYAIINAALQDGSNEANDYADTSNYIAGNEPLVLELSGTELQSPNRWQPLAFDYRITQNGIRIGEDIQEFIGVNWREVDTFAIERDSPTSIAVDPGPPPLLDTETQQDFLEAAIEVIRFSSYLDPNQSEKIDISPGKRLNNRLGFNNGTGRSLNPITGEAYEANEVNLADYGRILAEFWADGPASETPPGHWNTLHNELAEHPLFQTRFMGLGDPLTQLQWDIQAYLALNGAMHDAAVAAWTLKRQYDYIRPISIIRYLGALGQSTDPGKPSYHPQGLPLENDLVELITAKTTAAGQRHAHLSEHIGEIAIYAWAGEPEDPHTQVGGVDWIRAVDWLPYQRDTFVTPAFAAYVSGHSTFSRAAAEVMTLITGSPYFPGGIGEFTFKKSEYLEFEDGPSEDVTLQWATYYDAADQAGISRLYGGIHVRADDFVGRELGARIGLEAFLKMRSLRYGASAAKGLETLSIENPLSPDQPCNLFAYQPLSSSNDTQSTQILDTNESPASAGVFLNPQNAASNLSSLKFHLTPLKSVTVWQHGLDRTSSASVTFNIESDTPQLLFARLLGENAPLPVIEPIEAPQLALFQVSENDEEATLQSNASWTDHELASLIQVGAEYLNLPNINHDSIDAALIHPIGNGRYRIDVSNGSPNGNGAKLELYLLNHY